MPILLIGNWRLFGKRTIGVTFFPFIFIRKSWSEKQSKEKLDITINHESIHIKQQLELLVIPFYIFYFSEFLFRFLLTWNIDMSYRQISFEREAYKNENDLNYLKKRKFWSFIKYF